MTDAMARDEEPFWSAFGSRFGLTLPLILPLNAHVLAEHPAEYCFLSAVHVSAIIRLLDHSNECLCSALSIRAGQFLNVCEALRHCLNVFPATGEGFITVWKFA